MKEDYHQYLTNLCSKITGGHWAEESSSGAYYRLTAYHPTYAEVIAELRYPQRWDGEKLVPDKDRAAEIVWNLAFLVEARTAVPQLLEQVAQLTALLKDKDDVLEAVVRQRDAAERPGAKIRKSVDWRHELDD